jgi:hypothetical protein
MKTNLANLGRLLAVISKIETPSFVRILGYSNDKGNGEVANYTLNIGISYENAKTADALWLANPLNIAHVDFGNIDVAHGQKAWTEMFIAKNKPTNATKNRSEGQTDAYVNICPNVRVHKETGRVMVYGLVVSKEVTTVGKYDKVNSSFVTLAKKKIGKNLKTENFRQFAFDKLKTVKLKGEIIEITIG